MNRLLKVLLLAALVSVVSCGGSKKSKDSCPDGYEWSGTDCVQKTDSNNDNDTSDTDPVVVPDENDTDVADEEMPDDDTENPDDGKSDYHGSCKEIRNGDSYEINVETKKLTVGNITINGQSDNAALFGEIWAENRDTLSEFKIGDVNSEFSGKTMNIPKGRYSFAFRPVSSANKIVIDGLDNIDMTSGDRKLDFDLPLYHLKGKVLNNAGETFSAEGDTQLILKTGTFEKVISSGEFAGYDLLLPKGTYSVYFSGQLGSAQFKGTVMALGSGYSSGSDDEENNGLVIEDDTDYDIKVATLTFAGSIVKGGYSVTQGRLILVENPPFGAISGIVATDLSASSYSITVTAGAELNLIYEPEAGSYPVRYIKLETWNSKTETPSSHSIQLDFGRVHGKITFMGGNNFPTVSNCTEADCTIGKLKATGFDNTSMLVKDLGTSLATDGEGNITDVTYEALLVRRIAVTDSEGVVNYNPKTYTMNFESHLNDIKRGFSSLPFTVNATYTTDIGKLTSFSFSGEEGTWVTDKEINFDISPSKIEGKVTLNGSTFTMEKDDLIKLKDGSGMEYAVVNLSELSDGSFSFYAPAGTYSVLYDGEGLLSNEFKTYIERDFEINGSGSHDFEMKTGKITLDFDINGKSFAEWIKDNKNLESVGIAINIDKTASEFVFQPSKNEEGKYFAEILTGSIVNGYLELTFADKVASERSYSRIKLLSSYNMTSGITVKDPLTLIETDISVKLNGKAVAASNYAAKLKIQGNNPSEIYFPSENSVGAVFKKGEYKTPSPELYLNDGFEAKHDIALDCLYFGE